MNAAKARAEAKKVDTKELADTRETAQRHTSTTPRLAPASPSRRVLEDAEARQARATAARTARGAQAVAEAKARHAAAREPELVRREAEKARNAALQEVDQAVACVQRCLLRLGCHFAIRLM